MLEHINKSMFVMGGINYLLSNSNYNKINITTKISLVKLDLFFVVF